jgi:hypothetical protein
VLGFMVVILLHGGHQHVLATHRHLHGGENRNTNIIKMCLNHSIVLKIMYCSIWLKFTVK